MTTGSRWALGVASLTMLLICLLAVGALGESARAAGPEQDTPCSEGCHEARPGPPPEWHTYHLGRSTPAPNSPEQAPTSLALSPSSWAVGAGEVVDLMAVVRNAEGAPVPQALVHFYVDAEFIGRQGQVEIGSALTDAQGVAFLDYQPTLTAEKQRITARFEGQGADGPSERAVEIRQVEPPMPGYRIAPVGLEGVGSWVLVSFLVALVGVWLAFGYIAYQGYAIARGR